LKKRLDVLNIRKLGRQHLNSIIRSVAENSDDSDELEISLAILETCKGLVEGTQLSEALTATAENAADHLQRERDVVRSLMDTMIVRTMI
jgi:hypothetical protein